MKQIAEFKTGDIVQVQQKFNDGKRERIVAFEGQVIKVRGQGDNKMFTVRQFIDGIGVDRIMPIMLPSVVAIKVLKASPKVRGRLPRKVDFIKI